MFLLFLLLPFVFFHASTATLGTYSHHKAIHTRLRLASPNLLTYCHQGFLTRLFQETPSFMMEAASDFPKFADGDVTVMVSSSKTYRLHSHILCRLSPILSRLIDQYPGAKLTAAAKREGSTAYRLELRASPREDGIGNFARVKVNDNGKILRESDPYPFLNVSHFGKSDGQEKCWDWLFGSFYNVAPKFEDHNLATVLNSCMGLVDVAETIEAVEHIREHVDLALLRQDQVLWRSIAANPTAWTELGCRLHSPTIFKEGVIHLVGLWQKMSEEERAELRPEIRGLVQAKWYELDLAKQAIDLRILGHYPAFLCRSHADKPHRTSYSTDIYMWMAICFFRHWYAQAISEGRNRVSVDGGFEFYNQLAQGGNSYLHHEDFKTFHQYFPMSSKACNVLEANMSVLKEEVKTFVKDLVKVQTRVKDADFQVKWLTCAVIEKNDFPWEQANLAAAEQPHDLSMVGLANDNGERSPLTPVEALDSQTNDFMGAMVRDNNGTRMVNEVFPTHAALVEYGEDGLVSNSSLNDER